MRPFPIEALTLPDADLCTVILDWWVAFQAEDKGIAAADLTPQQVCEIVVNTRSVNLEDFLPAHDAARNAALEKILRLAANGDLRAAGLFRAYFQQEAVAMKALQEAISGQELRGAIQAGGRTGVESRQAEARKRREQVLTRARELIAGGKPRSSVASIIAREVGLSARQVRTFLHELASRRRSAHTTEKKRK